MGYVHSCKYVVSVTDKVIRVRRELLRKIYEAWLQSPSFLTIRKVMAKESLDLVKLGFDPTEYLDSIFRTYGKPSQDMDLLWERMERLDPKKVETTCLATIQVLLESGLFIGTYKKVMFHPSFEEKLYQAYPEQSVEDGIKNAGLDPRLVGRYRMNLLMKKFDNRIIKENGPDGVLPYDQLLESYKDHPYVQEIQENGLVLRDAFFNDASCLSGLSIEEILAVFEISADAMGPRDKAKAKARLVKWKMKDDQVSGESPLLIKINRNRIVALEKIIDDHWKELGKGLPSLTLLQKREVFQEIQAFAHERHLPGEIGTILKAMGVNRSSFYGCLANERYGIAEAEKEKQDEVDAEMIRKVYEYKGFKKGVRLVCMMLPHICGVTFNIKKVRRLMRKYGMNCGVRKPNQARRNSKEFMDTHVKPNLLKRRFRLGRPNKYRLTDVTYMDFGPCDKNGKRQRAYGSAMIDSVTGKLITLNVSIHNDEDLVLETLRLAEEYPWIEGGMIHSDQGILYLSDEFQKKVKEMGLKQSMSKRGNCWDNSPMESVFGHIKDEVDYSSCQDIEELRTLLERYAWYYNNERPMMNRLKMTPIEYEEYLCSLNEEEFQAYLNGEAKIYLDKKEEAKKLAIKRAKTLGIDNIMEDKGHGESGKGNE
ncbi:MAG: IS3 family transposase [Lachnospiraceae bacterium]|nr:IS3 family transposase [Lachnospiraceae bacterium]